MSIPICGNVFALVDDNSNKTTTTKLVLFPSKYKCMLCSVHCFRAMNTFRFTAQPASGVRQRPFLMPPQLTLTPSPQCFVASHPSVIWGPAINNSPAVMQPPPNHIIGPFPPNFTLPPPLPDVYAPVTGSSKGNCPPLTQFQTAHAFPVSRNASGSSSLSVLKDVVSSPQAVYHLSSELKSSQCDREVKDAASKQSSEKNNNDVDLRLSLQTDCPLTLLSLEKKNNMKKNGVQKNGVKKNSVVCTPLTGVSSTASSYNSVVSSSSVDDVKCASGSSSAITLTAVSNDKLITSISETFSHLSISAPLFVPNIFSSSQHLPAPGNWKPIADASGIEDGFESGFAVSECVKKDSRESTVSLYSTASPSSSTAASSLSSPVVTTSTTPVGRGRQLMDLLARDVGRKSAAGLFFSVYVQFLSSSQ